LANERDVPYQPLLKVFLADQVRQERSALITYRAALDFRRYILYVILYIVPGLNCHAARPPH